MFQSFARKAIVAARPVKIRGVALVSISVNANVDPNIPFAICLYASKIFAPAKVKGIDANKIATKAEIIGMPIVHHFDGISRGSIRIMLFHLPSLIQ